MYVFTRRARIRAGGINDAIGWAIGVTEKVRQITGLDVSLWQSMFGPEVGTLAWTTSVPDLLALETMTDKLAADPGFAAEIDRGRTFVPDGADDRLMQRIHPQPDASAPAPVPTLGSYATVVSSTCAPGGFVRGMSLGVEIAQRAEAVTGVPLAFFADATGSFGGVSWISVHPNIEDLQRAENAINADPEFAALLDREAPGVYSGDLGATTQLIYRCML